MPFKAKGSGNYASPSVLYRGYHHRGQRRNHRLDNQRTNGKRVMQWLIFKKDISRVTHFHPFSFRPSPLFFTSSSLFFSPTLCIPLPSPVHYSLLPCPLSPPRSARTPYRESGERCQHKRILGIFWRQ